MATPASLVDSNYQDGDFKEEEDNLVSYQADDIDMSHSDDDRSFDDNDDRMQSEGMPPAAPNFPSPPPLPPPEPPVASPLLAGSRAMFQLRGIFPDPPEEKCNPKLQQKVNGFLERIKRGEVPTPVRHIRSTKNFNNPEILSEIVSQFEIVEHGTHFRPDVWNPYQFPKEDYIDALQLSGAPKPAAPTIIIKSTPPKEATTPTPTTATPVTPAVAKSTTIITRKSGAGVTPVASGVPSLGPTRPSLVDYARALAQGFAAPNVIPR